MKKAIHKPQIIRIQKPNNKSYKGFPNRALARGALRTSRLRGKIIDKVTESLKPSSNLQPFINYQPPTNN